MVVPGKFTLYSPSVAAGYADFVIRWRGSDPSGICDYQLWSEDHTGSVLLLHEGMATSYRFTANDDFDGAGYNYWFFHLRAMDCAGNWSRTSSYNNTFYWPTDRYIPGPSGATSMMTVDDSGLLGYVPSFSTGWSTGTCACFVGGTNRNATKAGSSVTISDYARTFGWIAERGPMSGSARVYQDGVLKAIVSLYSKTKTGPTVVWANWFAVAKAHTIRIVVVGTAGHPRVDVDGFVLN